MKLQINSLEALERLIGGDSEIELELRQWIVTEFTKRYLKGIVTRDLDSLEAAARSEVQKLFAERFGKMEVGSWSKRFVFSEEARKQAEWAIRSLIEDEIKIAVDNVVRSLDLSSLVKKSIDKVVTDFIKEEIRNGIQKKWKEVRDSL